ncbi:uncharacterized protein LOC109413035 [Aedes albopictus]|uniref:Leucine-rich immune protein (Short) n=1 Tax=Aedes albopictus TaxID=7160 RepID=A0ABM1XSD6_AEDAL|nr:uncharacterized protein LOC109413035 [Aedes albopictus]
MVHRRYRLSISVACFPSIVSEVSMALKLWCCIFLAVLLENQHVHAAAERPTATAFRCLNEESSKCTINRIDLGDLGDSEIVLPDLRNKTTLQIKGGNMSTFGLSDRLGNVKRLQLGSLQLRELCLTYMLREVSAANNNISSVQFLSSSAKYELEHLDLHSNALATLEGFDVLVNLVEVHLEHNALESFNWTVFERMVKLEKLYLNGNKIMNVMATNEIELPVLEYLSLAGNHLTNLDVSNWKFESLTEYDFSSNNLSRVDNLKERFPSSQAVLLANNRWYCGWLEDTLEEFNKLFVVIKDRDESCEGITSANICCTPEKDTIPEDTELDKKLAELEQAQEVLQSDFETRFENLKTDNENDLKDLISKYDKLLQEAPLPTSSSNPATPTKNTQYTTFAKSLEDLNTTVTMELRDVAIQLSENERAQRRLSYIMLELKKSIERGRKTTADLQEQLDNLRSDIYKKLKKRN